jgi:hypothetical protein
MDEIIPVLVNLGLGGAMAAALIWFLYHLVTKTLPEINRAHRKLLLTERKLRFREHRRLLELMDRQGNQQLQMMERLAQQQQQMMERLAQQQQEQHEALLTHIDTNLKELSRLMCERLTVIEQRLDTQEAADPHTKPGPRPRA